MRKYIAAAVAAGALAVGGAASAQDLGTIISNVLGIGNPTPTYNVPGVPYGAQVYQNQNGQQFYYDQYGRQVIVAGGTQWNIVGYDSQGNPLYGTDAYGTGGSGRFGNYGNNGNNGNYGNYGWGYGNNRYRNDRDGDGVPDAYDRYPDDPRYR
jgi:hypothetical protein